MSSEAKGILDGGGFGTAIMSSFLYIADKLSILDVNQYLIAVTSLCGIVWVAFKIRGQYLDNKLKKLDNKLKQKEIDKK
jgi:hypothetical protein